MSGRPKIERLSVFRPPAVAVRRLPQCDADVRDINSVNYRERAGKDLRCTFPAHFRIGTKNYCTRHGGELALRILLGEGKP